MTDYLYQDVLIEDGDLVLDAGGIPVLIQDRAVIAQDIKHAIIESNLPVMLIGDNSPTSRADTIKQIELLVEEDIRLVPGTTSIQELLGGILWITAETSDFGLIEVEIRNG